MSLAATSSRLMGAAAVSLALASPALAGPDEPTADATTMPADATTTPADATTPPADATPPSIDVEAAGYTLTSGNASFVGSARAVAKNWIVMPEGAELGGELHFLTSDVGGLGEEGTLRFTDVMLARAHGRYALGGRAEVFGGVDLLPKQPSYTDELIWQGADLGVRVAVGTKMAAWARVSGGPLLADAGYAGSADAGLMARSSVDETIAFQGALGGSFTSLFESDGDGTPWLAEAVIRGDTILRVPNGIFAGWLGCALAIPVAHADAPAVPGGMAMDPQPRVDVHLGMVYAVVESWDLFAELAWIDRGDVSDPATLLPVLDGGFDQQQIIFGVTRRFDFAKDGARPSMTIAY